MKNASEILAACVLAAGILACQPSARDDAHTDAGKESSNRCATCHMAEFNAARKPVHLAEKATACAVCHVQTSWHPLSVRQHAWELTGAHEKAKCLDCHKGEPPLYDGTGKACIDCHRPEYEKAPWHVEHTLTACADCHGTAKWKPPLHEWEPEPPPPVAVPTPDAGGAPDAQTAIVKPKVLRPYVPRPIPKPTTAPTVTAPPDVTTGGSRRR